MPTYTKKAQVLFTEQQYRELMMIAEQEAKPLGALLRNAAGMGASVPERKILRP